jgi:hypothetical protein
MSAETMSSEEPFAEQLAALRVLCERVSAAADEAERTAALWAVVKAEATVLLSSHLSEMAYLYERVQMRARACGEACWECGSTDELEHGRCPRQHQQSWSVCPMHRQSVGEPCDTCWPWVGY